jgi:hypothetical protein
MAKNFKELVKKIEKLAQAAPPPPPGALLDPGMGPFGGGSGFSEHGGTDPGRGGGGGSTTIMAMQHALQDLAADVSRQINISQVVSQDPREQEEAKARDMFNTFITKNYMRNAAVPGVEYDPDPKVNKMLDKEKTQNDPTRMSVVMDTMNRVGKERSESFVDGNWGPRTNAAIRDAFAFATGLFSMIDDINRLVPPTKQIHSDTIYTKDSLHELSTLATVDNSLTPEQKSESAHFVTLHIKAIKNLYDDVKNKFLQHPAYRQFIEHDVSYKTYAPSVSQNQIAMLRKYFPQGIRIDVPGAASGLPIAIDDLVSLDALKKWMNTSLSELTVASKVTPSTIIDQVTKSMDHMTTPAESQQGLLAQNPPSDLGY